MPQEDWSVFWVAGGRHGRYLETMTQFQKLTRHSMRIYLKNIRAKFHPNLIWNDRALGFCWSASPWQEQEQLEE